MMMKLDAIVSTGGTGMWSDRACPVRLTGMELHWDEGDACGELRVYFDTRDWHTGRDGMIYTDAVFLDGLRQLLAGLGCVDSGSVDYSEQGMQGSDWVSLDVSAESVPSFRAWHARQLLEGLHHKHLCAKGTAPRLWHFDDFLQHIQDCNADYDSEVIAACDLLLQR